MTTTQAQPAPAPAPELSLFDLDELAQQFSISYASPHHFVMSVEGLRNLQAAFIAKQGATK